MGRRFGENTYQWWKKFGPGRTQLTVEYNSYPETPDTLANEGRPCATGGGRPYLATGTPTLSARVRDPDGGALTAVFTWQRWDSGSNTWQPLGADQRDVTAGQTARLMVPNGMAHGGTYRWQVQAFDHWSTSGVSGSDASPVAGWCEFTVDTVRPAVPSVSSTDYPDDGQPHAGVGRTGSFTLSPGGSTDVASYLYGWQDPPSSAVPAPDSGTAVVRATPPPVAGTDFDGGPTTLYVQVPGSVRWDRTTGGSFR